MEPLSQATEVVRRAEGELRQLLLVAAEQGDYERVGLLADWAKQLRQMVQQHGSVDRKSRSVDPVNEQPQARSEPEAFATTIRKRTNARKGKAKRNPKAKKTKAVRREYPKFLRDGEELLKIGWSKRQKAAYRHKAPKRIVLLVAQALQRTAQNGDRFVMDQVLPIRDQAGSDGEIPSYQAYLSLAWLRKENLILQHGRQGYSLPSDTDLTHAVEVRWMLLPKS